MARFLQFNGQLYVISNVHFAPIATIRRHSQIALRWLLSSVAVEFRHGLQHLRHDRGLRRAGCRRHNGPARRRAADRCRTCAQRDQHAQHDDDDLGQEFPSVVKWLGLVDFHRRLLGCGRSGIDWRGVVAHGLHMRWLEMAGFLMDQACRIAPPSPGRRA